MRSESISPYTAFNVQKARPVPPCGKVCPKRSVGCRDGCEKWAKYEAQYKAYDARRTAEQTKRITIHNRHRELNKV